MKRQKLIIRVPSKDLNLLDPNVAENWDAEMVGVGGPHHSQFANFIATNEPSAGPAPEIIEVEYEAGDNREWTENVLQRMRRCFTPSMTWEFKE